MNFAGTRTLPLIPSFLRGGDVQARPVRNPDEALRDRLLSRLEADASWRSEHTNVLVRDGLVTLQGLFNRAADRAASVAIVRAMPGVRAVDDRRVRSREWQAMA